MTPSSRRASPLLAALLGLFLFAPPGGLPARQAAGAPERLVSIFHAWLAGLWHPFEKNGATTDPNGRSFPNNGATTDPDGRTVPAGDNGATP
ncbi:MAG: hypothetical protein QOF89_1543 [Acidobacteriota bacterium]|jgi:hypothetical protein|nr:hypothetical protein [Acidobacteriota bacterium]